MPFLDAYIPDGALSRAAEQQLVGRLTDLLLKHEGVDPQNQTARHLAWVFVHRLDTYVAGRRPKSPRYRFVSRVPEGQYTPERRAALTSEITEAVAAAENGAYPHPELRVAVLTYEVLEGAWGGGGRILGLADIYELAWPPHPGMGGDPRATAEQVLLARRRDHAARLLAALDVPVPASPRERTEKPD